MFFRKQKPVGNDNRPVASQPTHIGADSVIDGNISSEGEIHVEGMLRGTLKARICIVAASGTIEGEISAEDIIIRGRVIGPLHGDHVHLQDGAWVQGDITSATIAIDTGARLSGAVWQANGAHEIEPPAARSTPAIGYQEPPQLFGDSLWGNRQDEEFRPLKTVKPRASNGRS
jgi:cytoskeletal protein CcmA (bactofilin family)